MTNNLMMKIEKNRVKLAYYNYISMMNNLKEATQEAMMIDKYLKKFSDEQLLQYRGLIANTLKLEDISDISEKEKRMLELKHKVLLNKLERQRFVAGEGTPDFIKTLLEYRGFRESLKSSKK